MPQPTQHLPPTRKAAVLRLRTRPSSTSPRTPSSRKWRARCGSPRTTTAPPPPSSAAQPRCTASWRAPWTSIWAASWATFMKHFKRSKKSASCRRASAWRGSCTHSASPPPHLPSPPPLSPSSPRFSIGNSSLTRLPPSTRQDGSHGHRRLAVKTASALAARRTASAPLASPRLSAARRASSAASHAASGTICLPTAPPAPPWAPHRPHPLRQASRAANPAVHP